MKILAVAGDAGGARALLPVISQLRSTSGVTVECRAYAAAVEIWKAASFQPHEIVPQEERRIDRILLGTSVQPEMWELKIIQQAREAGIRTVSVLDFWSNYRERFTTADRTFILPDAIAIMDEQTQQDMMAVGFPAECLSVTGQPAFDELGKYEPAEVRLLAYSRLRQLLDCAADETCILYVSQPLSQLFSRETLGFHEADVLLDVIESLSRPREQRSARATLIVKLHPREMLVPYSLPPSPSPRLSIKLIANDTMAPREIVVGSDLIVGINSMLLMESCLLKKPTISYQPSLRIQDPLPSNHRGWSRAVYRRSELDEALNSELFDSLSRSARKSLLAGIPPMSGATERVIALLMNQRGE